MANRRVVGGVLALIGGLLVLITCLLSIGVLGLGEPYSTAWIINLVVAAIALLGGILGLAKLRAGGFLLLLIGMVSIVCATIAGTAPYMSYNWWAFEQYSLMAWLAGGHVKYISLEAALMVVGGIIIVASKAEE
ncbi:MAG: hypothetical protein HWN65_14510 [Candidatus Helarchaeota archaeon]|nr:hypothetical protein [Candidatus Helarchaeota archaeon]